MFASNDGFRITWANGNAPRMLSPEMRAYPIKTFFAAASTPT